MNYISTAWDKIKANSMRNCFLVRWNDLEQIDNSPLEDEEFQSLQNFLDYATMDHDLVTRALKLCMK